MGCIAKLPSSLFPLPSRMRYFITLSYDGTAYHGWQIQPNGLSVQQCLEQALTTLLREDTAVVGAGRTDAGVHALKMIAHFDTEQQVDCARLADKLNRLLPPDIAVQRVQPVAADAHARFSATSRTYHYYVSTAKDPFNRHRAMRLFHAPDFERMNEAAQKLFEYIDFTSFSKLHTDVATNNCRIMQARWEQVGEHEWRFVIQADRFLRNMVRAVVGTLLEVGRGKMTVDEFCRVIEKKDRCSAGTSVPGHALFLVDVAYPEEIYL